MNSYGNEPTFQQLIAKGLNYYNNNLYGENGGYFNKINQTPGKKYLNKDVTLNNVYGSLPSDYKRTELLARGDIYGALPSDYKSTELATRNVTKDSGAKGTQTSPGRGMNIMSMKNADDLYKELGLGPYHQNNPFSQKLDTSNTNFPTEPITGIDTGEMGDYMGPASTNFFNNEAASNIEGIPTAKLFSKELDLDIVDKPETQRERARRAFLDTDESMKALRARDRELGMMYAGGNYYELGDDGEFQKNADGKTNKPLTAKEFKDRFKNNLISSKASENPFAQQPAPASFDTEFNTERKVDIGTTQDLGNQFDMENAFDFNNPETPKYKDEYFNGEIDLSKILGEDFNRTPYMRSK